MENIEKFKEYQTEIIASPVKPSVLASWGCGCFTVMLTAVIIGIILIFKDISAFIIPAIIIEIVLFTYIYQDNLKKSEESLNKVLQIIKNLEEKWNISSKPNICLEGSMKNSPNDYYMSYIYIDNEFHQLYIINFIWRFNTSRYEVKEIILDFTDILDYKINYRTETAHTAVGTSFDNPLSNSSQIAVGNAYGTSTEIPTNIVVNTKDINNSSINICCTKSNPSLVDKFTGWLKIIKSDSNQI